MKREERMASGVGWTTKHGQTTSMSPMGLQEVDDRLGQVAMCFRKGQGRCWRSLLDSIGRAAWRRSCDTPSASCSSQAFNEIASRVYEQSPNRFFVCRYVDCPVHVQESWKRIYNIHYTKASRAPEPSSFFTSLWVSLFTVLMRTRQTTNSSKCTEPRMLSILNYFRSFPKLSAISNFSARETLSHPVSSRSYPSPDAPRLERAQTGLPRRPR